MSISSKIREQIIGSFRAELAEHVQELNDGLLAIEQHKVTGKAYEETLANIFRAAHSLKGAARAVGVTAIEQLAHALEDVLGAMQRQTIELTPGLFSACYHAVDACQMVQTAYDAGEATPPVESLRALSELDAFIHPAQPATPEVLESNLQPPEAPDKAVENIPAAASSKGAPKGAGSIKQNLETLFTSLDDIMNGSTDDAPVSDRPASDQPPLAPVAEVSPAPASFTEPPQAVKEERAPKLPEIQEPQDREVQPTPASPQPSAPAATDETIRVSVAKLDSLMAQLSELLVTKIRLEQRLEQVRQTQTYVAQWQKEWLADRGTYSRLVRQDFGNGDSSVLAAQRKDISHLLEYVDVSQTRLRDVTGLVNNLAREFNSDAMQMSLAIDSLEDDIKRVRMLPLSTITGSFARMVRDLAQASGKDAMLEIIGGDVELDKRVLEQIKDPITHLLRNAIDHGLETPQTRMSLGKTPYGVITLSAAQQGKDVAISIMDDGAGVDIESIRHTAMRRGIANAQSMTEAELVELIYNAGFSTSPIITDVSGRGVGLDVVRRNVELLRGRINLDWKAGLGSTFTLVIPLALTSSRGLLVRASNQLFAIPLNAIERIEYVKTGDVVTVGGHDTLRYDGRPLMLVDLASVLNLPPSADQVDRERIPVVILSAAERRMAFAIDGMADEQEVVIKGLGKQLARVGGIAGASVMGNGEVILILNVADIIKLALRGERRSVLEKAVSKETATTSIENQRRRILIVDNSITTRTLEKNILEAAGHEVLLAMDGLEAYKLVSSGDLPNLIISDVSMPRLDGFGLTQRIKSETRTANIPVILVTSLDSAEDKARGIECGADAYITKSSFDQNNLLETIEQLI